MKKSITPEQIITATKRFYKHVDKRSEDECWPYTGYKNADGYGQFRFLDQMIGAHVFARALKLGHWPKNNSLHKCDNPPCCNPKHLYGGTHRRNMLDMYQKERHAKTHPNFRNKNLSGNRNPNSFLTWKLVREIRTKYAEGISRLSLSIQYQVSNSTIDRIVLNKSWIE